MEIFDKSITYQEVPDKICFTLFVAGCKNNCKNCSWKGKFSKSSKLKLEDFEKEILDKKNYVDVIVFLGGEWLDDFIDYLKVAKKCGFETCLYTGLDDVSNEIKNYLDYLKVGKYIEERGSLFSRNTNQRFYDLKNNKEIKFYEQQYC